MDKNLAEVVAGLHPGDRKAVEFVDRYLSGHDLKIAASLDRSPSSSAIVSCDCGWIEWTLMSEVSFRVARHANEVIDQLRRELPGWLLEEMG